MLSTTYDFGKPMESILPVATRLQRSLMVSCESACLRAVSARCVVEPFQAV
jgi:hypothetical protein